MLLIALAVLASVLTVVLLVWVLRSLRPRPEAPIGAHPRERRRSHASARDPREALALVGNALAATHNARALLPLILEVMTEATGSLGGQLVQGDEEIGWIGDVGADGEPLAMDLTTPDEDVTTTLYLYPPKRGFKDETRTLAEWLAAQAAIALENARLHEKVQQQAATDELTNLVNRRRFMEALEAELARARIMGSPLSVVLADLDDFKLINDRYGHHAGDQALKAFGEHLRMHLREVDVAGRVGGEEFAILLPETDTQAATAVAQRVRGALAETPIAVTGDERVSLTASFGIAELAAGQSADALLRLADVALYQAKGEGKNCVRVATDAVEGAGRRLTRP